MQRKEGSKEHPVPGFFLRSVGGERISRGTDLSVRYGAGGAARHCAFGLVLVEEEEGKAAMETLCGRAVSLLQPRITNESDPGSGSCRRDRSCRVGGCGSGDTWRLDHQSNPLTNGAGLRLHELALHSWSSGYGPLGTSCSR